MKLQPVTKLHKGNRTTLTKFDGNVISKNCDAIDIFPVYGQVGAIRKPNSNAYSVKLKSV